MTETIKASNRAKRFRRHSEEFDFPTVSEIVRTIFVCGTARSGSTLLCDLMDKTGRLGRPDEYFNPRWVPVWLSRAGVDSFAAALPFLMRKRTGPGGLFCVKSDFRALAAIASQVDLAAHFPNPRFIYIHRADLIGQAISLVRAQQTEAWDSDLLEESPAVYSRDLIIQAAQRTVENEANWRLFFALHGIVPITVTYEGLAGDPIGTLRRVWDEFDMGPWNETLVIAPGKKAQRDGLNAEWRGRLRRELVVERIDPDRFMLEMAANLPTGRLIEMLRRRDGDENRALLLAELRRSAGRRYPWLLGRELWRGARQEYGSLKRRLKQRFGASGRT